MNERDDERDRTAMDDAASHLTIESLDARVLPTPGSRVMLSIRSLTVRLGRDGLQTLATALVPDYPLTISIETPGSGSGCLLTVQARQWGFEPRIQVRLDAFGSTAGSILINLTPARRWSPADQAMLGIAVRNLSSVASTNADLRILGSNAYQFDVQRFVRERLIESGVPLRWDTALTRVERAGAAIQIVFEPDVLAGSE
jgi:hypothetical protein